MTLDRSWTYFSYLPNVPGARASRIGDAVTMPTGRASGASM